MQWDLLRSFLAVLRAGSLGRAAVELGVSQPSLGRHVRELERQLGRELFERRGQRLVPTAFAQQVAQAASGMLQSASEIERLTQRASSRSVRISASRMVATYLLPSVIAQLERKCDIELSSEDHLSNLIESEADLAVRLVKPVQRSLIARRVGSIRFGLYASRVYLRRYPAPQSAQELALHTVVGFDRSESMVRTARRLGIGLERGAIGFRSDDRVVHWAAVRAGVGIGVIPIYLAEREPNVVRVLPDEKLGVTGVWLVARRDVLQREHVRPLFELLREGISAQLRGSSP